MQIKAILIIAAWYFLISTKKAEAYIDLGTGSYVAQVFIAAIVAAFFFLKGHYIKGKTWIKSLFRNKKNE